MASIRLTAAAHAAGPAADEIRRTTQEVLSRPEYAQLQPGWWGRLLEEVRSWLAARLLDLVQAASISTVAWAIVAVGVLVAGLVAWRVLRGTRREPAADDGLEVTTPRRTADEWAARARQAEERGDLRAAVRAAYRSVVAGLAEAGVIEEVPGRTVGEYRSAVAEASPSQAAAFDRASEVFERVWYAHDTPTPDDLATVRAAARATTRVPT